MLITSTVLPLMALSVIPYSEVATHHPAIAPASNHVRYMECLRNHAAMMGRHALDGCGEFFPGEGPAATFTCAACGCHRNFHRREVRRHVISANIARSWEWGRVAVTPPARRAEERVAREERTAARSKRAKFSDEQKEKMRAFMDNVEWTLKRTSHWKVSEFCREVGVDYRAFKVWVRNNKARSRDGNGCKLTT